ncbi:MAG: RNA polymerase sigma factor SigZ [Desulfotomaculaceae bacterium]|nr:RNA polymerase sigma factor SigZ [Desulfotomaculaceae bacterium]
MAICTNRIWEDFSTPLKNYIKKRIPNELDSDDVLQEVFIRIHNNIGSLMDDNKIHAWIYRITRNTIADYYRKHDKVFPSAELSEELTDEFEEDQSFNGEISACLRTMIDQLPEKYKQAIIITEFQNVTQKELSQKMGISLSGAKSRVQRAKEKLKEMLLDCCYLELDRRGNVIDYKHKSEDCKYCQ